MTTAEKLLYKNELLQNCAQIITKRIEISLMAMKSAQDAANSEDKSSAGDKYETSRAMSHIDKDMYARQLAANKIELAQLLTIDCGRRYDIVASGSLVACADISFFIAAGLGKLNMDGRDIFLLSPQAPLAKTMMGKKKGEMIKFSNKDMLIVEIY
ncbi:MAG: hypothetical protein ABIN67_15690 [Ferruginibacter sp.]